MNLTGALSSEEHTGLFLDQIALLRSQKDLRPISIDTSLSEAAAEISRAMLKKAQQQYPLPEELLQYHIESYITYNPFRFPEKVTVFLRHPGLTRLGLGVTFKSDPVLPSGAFYVTLIGVRP